LDSGHAGDQAALRGPLAPEGEPGSDHSGERDQDGGCRFAQGHVNLFHAEQVRDGTSEETRDDRSERQQEDRCLHEPRRSAGVRVARGRLTDGGALRLRPPDQEDDAEAVVRGQERCEQGRREDDRSAVKGVEDRFLGSEAGEERQAGQRAETQD